MKIPQLIISLLILLLYNSCQKESKNKVNYIDYHKSVISAEKLIAEEKYEEGLKFYNDIFESYNFVFLRDYQITSQLAFYLDKDDKGLNYIKKGISAGWKLDSIKTNKFLLNNLTSSQWKSIEIEYNSLHEKYLKKINSKLRNRVEKMYQKDQEIAYKAYQIENEDEQEKFITENFPSHSISQIKSLIEIIDNIGYPGELLIGNDFWMSTIISHHNSISQDFVKKDTLYKHLKPKLFIAIEKGQISPYELAMIEDWRIAVYYENSSPGFGFLNLPNRKTKEKTNKNRKNIGLRSIELRNKLVDIERKIGLNLYLPDWINGKIKIN